MWLHTPVEITDLLVNHFSNQYRAPPTKIDMQLFDCISPRISNAQCQQLLQPVTPAAIKEALHFIGSGKAPSPDDYTNKFLKLLRETTCPQIIDMVVHLFQHNHLQGPINDTNITLLPKIPNPTKPSHFRPIELCNVVYKIIAKILVDKIIPVLQFIISPSKVPSWKIVSSLITSK